MMSMSSLLPDTLSIRTKVRPHLHTWGMSREMSLVR